MGDPDLTACYRTLSPAVLGYLRGQRAPEPEDLLGEVFLQVARDIHRFTGDDEDLRRWVFTIARHRLIDDARRRNRRPVADGWAVPERPVLDEPLPVDPGLVTALQQLTDDQREVLLLRFVADLSIEAVARIMGRRAGAVKTLQHRALERLRSAVSPHDG